MTDYLEHRKNFDFIYKYKTKSLKPNFEEMFTVGSAAIIGQRRRSFAGMGLGSDGKR
jgi:hypothetical protein|tara:strand:- start:1049 stop:1219 length:171 start_codon:yes stop_codon:yes gene_type:complete